jgi:hypothetical protein
MIIKTFILFFVLISCQEPNVKSKKYSKLKNENVTMSTKSKSEFSGKFLGVLNGSEIIVSLIPERNSNKIHGEFSINNELASITAVESDGVVKGSISEDVSKKTYEIKMEFKVEKLHLSMTFPEYDNQTVTIILEKEISSDIIRKNNSNKPINQDLVGTWRYTEVLSSGSGEYYASFSTDYFIQFKANGECITWTGQSAGGDANTIIESSNATNIEHAKWYIKNNTIVFVNITTQKEVSLPYYCEQNRMMLKGSVNRVYQKIY